MELFELFIESWYIIIGIISVLTLGGVKVVRFIRSPKVIKAKRFRLWLLAIVTEAEKEMGSNTGELKLLHAYEEFVSQFPIFSLFITFDSFKLTVDEALKQMKKLLENEDNRKYIKNESGALVECATCTTKIEKLSSHNGEMLCESCYTKQEEEF